MRLRLLCPYALVPALIGKVGGRRVGERARTSCAWAMPPLQTASARHCSPGAPALAIAGPGRCALHAVAPPTGHHPRPPRHPHFRRACPPPPAVFAVTATLQKGDNVKRIRAASGATVSVADHQPAGCDERVVIITGERRV